MSAAKVRSAPAPADDVAALRIVAAARLLDVSRDTLYQLVRRGEIPHTRVGASIRIRRVDLDAYVAARVTSTWSRVDRRGRPSR